MLNISCLLLSYENAHDCYPMSKPYVLAVLFGFHGINLFKNLISRELLRLLDNFHFWISISKHFFHFALLEKEWMLSFFHFSLLENPFSLDLVPATNCIVFNSSFKKRMNFVCTLPQMILHKFLSVLVNLPHLWVIWSKAVTNGVTFFRSARASCTTSGGPVRTPARPR